MLWRCHFRRLQRLFLANRLWFTSGRRPVRMICVCCHHYGLSIWMQTHKRTLFISVFMKAGHPRRAEKEKKENVMASCKPKITRRPLWPRVRAPCCCKHQGHISAAAPSQPISWPTPCLVRLKSRQFARGHWGFCSTFPSFLFCRHELRKKMAGRVGVFFISSSSPSLAPKEARNPFWEDSKAK